MDDLIGILLVGLAILAGVGLALWALAWLAFQFFALAGPWMLALGFVAGFVLVTVHLFAALWGRGVKRPVVATPARVASGVQYPTGPRGAARAHGWDEAWPAYAPTQLLLDNRAMWSSMFAGYGGIIVAWNATGWRTGTIRKLIWGIVRVILFFPVFAGFWAGNTVAVLALGIPVTVFGWLLCAGHGLFVGARRAASWLARRVTRTTVTCPHCYWKGSQPAYQCSNDDCGVVHHDLRPSRLGRVARVCACGQHLPTGTLTPARSLTPLCQRCERELHTGSGTRKIVYLPVFGALGAGKTRFVYLSLTGLQMLVTETGHTMKALDSRATATLAEANRVADSKIDTTKTAADRKPVGWPFQLATGKRAVELMVFDTAGEFFESEDSTTDLYFLADARTLVFVVDPFSTPALNPAVGADTVSTLGDSYSAVVDQLRGAHISLKSKALAVVVSKTDLLHRSPGSLLEPGAADDEVKRWLGDQGAAGVIERIHRDFSSVRYFAIDSAGEPDPASPGHPVSVLRWTLERESKEIVLPPMATVGEEQLEEKAA